MLRLQYSTHVANCVLKTAGRLSLHVIVITELTAFTQEPMGQSVCDAGQKDNAAISKCLLSVIKY